METHESSRVTRDRRSALLRGVYAVINEGERSMQLARAALGAGVRLIQYRAKGGMVPETLQALRTITSSAGALLIVNDDWRAAARFGCDGVHLGPDDDGYRDVRDARSALPGGIIGLSCGTVAEMLAANAMDADYAGVGAVFATASKADAGGPIGIDGLTAISRAAHMPVCAIGGITAANVAAVRSAGVAMAAVISALDVEDPDAAARALVKAFGV